ncbi:MAG: tetratricopeptide repeat protein [Verrucomicrobiales bacterium]|nr:tetratricopeptide repeat protein [Verrucomicrobiales bacterium]
MAQAVKDQPLITGSDFHALQAVEGWLALGNPHEALAEWEKISPKLQQHPDVLNARWQIAASLKNWDDAFAAASQLMEVSPNDPTSWIHRSYALRRCRSGGLQQAWDALLPAVQKFPAVSTIPYNLACYAAQLGRPSEAWDWLHRAIEAAEDVTVIKEMALQDEDLRSIWDRIKTI